MIEELDISAHFGDDIFRIMPSLPGVTGNDYSSKFIVRGDDYQNVLVMLDGQQLYRPFHLKDFGGIFSIVNNDLVGSLELSTGGFSSQYGNKMASVLNISSLPDVDDNSYSVGASFINLKTNAQGSFSEGNGHWLISARRGYLDIFIDASDDEEIPKLEFSDFFAKISYQITEQQQLAIRALLANDLLSFKDSYQESDNFIEDQLDSIHPSQYFWLTLNSNWSPKVHSITKLAKGKIIEDRVGYSLDPSKLDVWVDDYREYDFIDFNQRWNIAANKDSTWQLGYGILANNAYYNYRSYRYLYDSYQESPSLSRQFAKKFKGKRSHAFINHKYKISNNILTELGLRWDQQDDLEIKEAQVSPRISLAYLHSKNSVVRMSWGEYFQPDEIFNLQVSDGEQTFGKVQKAEHRIFAYKHKLPHNIHLNVEIYQKLISNPIISFENVFDTLVPFPESNVDRVKVLAEKSNMKGLELSASQNINQQSSWSANYTYSKAEDTINGIKVNRSWDQRHAINVMYNYLFIPIPLQDADFST